MPRIGEGRPVAFADKRLGGLRLLGNGYAAYSSSSNWSSRA